MTTTLPPSDRSKPTGTSTDPRAAVVAAMSRVPDRDRHRGRVVVVTLLSVAIVASAVTPYLLLDPAVAQHRVGLRPGVPLHFPFLVAHAVTGGIALLVGPFQFVRRVRRRPRVHRCLGRIFLFAGVFPASVAGMVVAWLSTAGPMASFGFALLDVAWLTSALAGYRAARARHYRDHERWMIRAFALTFAAVTLRVWLAILIVVQLPILGSHYHGDYQALFDTAYAFVPWLSWIPNLVLIEIYLSRSRSPRRSSRIAHGEA